MAARVVLNVSGTCFEMNENTWLEVKKGIPKTHMCEVLDEGHQFYVGGRHARAFDTVLSYYETNELHMPVGLCPSVVRKELQFWGISPTKLDKCCFSKYVSYFEDEKTMKVLEDDENCRLQQIRSLHDMITRGGWPGGQARMWLVLDEPFYSAGSKIYFVASSIVIMLSLFTLVAGTHPCFHGDMTEEQWQKYFGDDFNNYRHHFISSTPESSSAESLPSLPSDINIRHYFLEIIELVCLPLFAIDLFARLLVCPFRKRLLFSSLFWVDIIALTVTCTKYLVEIVHPKEKYEDSVVDVLHCLQIVRVLRLFRLVKNFVGFRVLLYAFKASRRELCMLMMFLIVAMLLFSTFIFFSGDDNFPSIPDAFWWAIITMTTVGYGDIVPKQGLSKVIGAFCALAGVCLIAVVIPIFVNNFMLFYSYLRICGKRNDHVQQDSVSLSQSDKIQNCRY